MNDFLKKFGFDANCIPRSFYEQAKAEQARRGNDILDFERFEIFTYMTPQLARLRDDISMDNDNVLYCYLLAAVIRSGDNALIKTISRPCADKGSELYDTLPLFALLDCVPDMKVRHSKLGIPSSITRDTLSQFENQIQDFIDLYHHYGISRYVSWMVLFLQTKILRIGRLNFEISSYRMPYALFTNGEKTVGIPKGITFHKSGQVLGSIGCESDIGAFDGEILETDDYYEGIKIQNGVAVNEHIRLYKREWKKLICEGDPVISVHIPSGDALTPEVCNSAFELAWDIFNRLLGNYKAFICQSWLLDPQIKALLCKQTNLTRFADRFDRFPLKSSGKSVFEYVWCLPQPVLPEQLTESSSIARAIKSHLLGGGHIYGSAGVINYGITRKTSGVNN